MRRKVKIERRAGVRGVHVWKHLRPFLHTFGTPADTCHHTVSGLFFILYFSLSCGSPPSRPFPLFLLHVFHHLPEGLSETCVCVQMCGCSCLESKGVKSRGNIKEYQGTQVPDETSFLRYHVRHLLLTLVIFCLFFLLPFFFFGSERVQLGWMWPSWLYQIKTLIYSQSLKHKFSN